LKEIRTPPYALHLATHGLYCGETETGDGDILSHALLQSAIILAGANYTISSTRPGSMLGDDGFLTALEASSLNLMGTKLVVLSACNSGVGDIVSGEGVYGLRRAFQQAGAQSVLMSLWAIPDKETYELMSQFYTEWVAGASKRKALRAAALHALYRSRREHGHGHPLLWGGFVLVGNYR
jgi:CHAT domain-containing protein